MKWAQAVDRAVGAGAASGALAGQGADVATRGCSSDIAVPAVGAGAASGAGGASGALTGPGTDAATRVCSGDIAVPTVLGGGGALTADERILTGIDCKEAAAIGGCVAAAAAEQ